MPGQDKPHGFAKVERYILEGFDGGLHSESSFSKVHITDTECTCAENIEFWPVGTISKRGGRIYKNTATQLSGPVTQIYQWWDETGANFLMAFTAVSGTTGSGGLAYFTPTSQTTGTFTHVFSGGETDWKPTADDNIVVESFGGSAIFTDGVHFMHAWHGTEECCAISGTTVPKAVKCIKGYKNYLFAGNGSVGGTTHQSRLWWSDPGNAHSWPASNYLDLDGDDGDYITGMEILGNELIVFKERKIFAVTYVGGVYEFYAESRMSGVGCSSPRSIIPIFSELLFYGIESFYSFNGRDVESLSDKIKDIITYSIQPSYRSTISGTTLEERDQVWWLVPIDSDTTSGNSHTLVHDYNRENWTAYTNVAASVAWYNSTSDLTFGDLGLGYGTYDLAWGSRLFLSNAALIITGTYDGYLVDNGTGGVMSDLGADFEGFWQSRWIDFGMPDINKRITRITVFTDREVDAIADDYNMYLDIYRDWDDSTPYSSQTISMFGVYPVLERRLDFTMSCRAVRLKIGTTKKNQPFTIHKIIIEYIPKGRTIVT